MTCSPQTLIQFLLSAGGVTAVLFVVWKTCDWVENRKARQFAARTRGFGGVGGDWVDLRRRSSYADGAGGGDWSGDGGHGGGGDGGGGACH